MLHTWMTCRTVDVLCGTLIFKSLEAIARANVLFAQHAAFSFISSRIRLQSQLQVTPISNYIGATLRNHQKHMFK